MKDYNEKISKGSYFLHIFLLILAIVIGSLISVIYKLNLPRTPILVSGPKDFEGSFEDALAGSNELSIFDYKIVYTDNKEDASLVIDYGKENDNTFEKCAYSPFVVGYCEDDSSKEKLEKSKLLVKSVFNEEKTDLDFAKIISAAIGDLEWDSLGLPNETKVYYPSKNTIYWHDFYIFMLINANDGIYPSTIKEKNLSKIKVQNFLNSKYTISVDNFYEMVKTNGFNSSTLYIFPEVCIIKSDVSVNSIRVFYPVNTYCLYFYVKSQNEIGDKLIKYISIDEDDYRSKENEDVLDDHFFNIASLRQYCNIIGVLNEEEIENEN